MKTAIMIASLVVSTSALAEPSFIARNDTGTDVFYGYLETLTQLSDGYTVMVGKRTPTTPEHRFYIGVSFQDCNSGFGTLMARASMNDKWTAVSVVTLESVTTVGDRLALAACDAGKQAFGMPNKRK